MFLIAKKFENKPMHWLRNHVTTESENYQPNEPIVQLPLNIRSIHDYNSDLLSHLIWPIMFKDKIAQWWHALASRYCGLGYFPACREVRKAVKNFDRGLKNAHAVFIFFRFKRAISFKLKEWGIHAYLARFLWQYPLTDISFASNASLSLTLKNEVYIHIWLVCCGSISWLIISFTLKKKERSILAYLANLLWHYPSIDIFFRFGLRHIVAHA